MKRLRLLLALFALIVFCGSLVHAALPTDVQTREHSKFQETPAGEVAVLVTMTGTAPAATAYYDGRKVVATAGTAVPLNATTLPFSGCTVQAEENNTGDIVIGASTVVASLATRRGILLLPGAAFTFTHTGDLLYTYIDSEVNGDGVHYFCRQ